MKHWGALKAPAITGSPELLDILATNDNVEV